MERQIPDRVIAEDILVAPCKPEGEAETLDEETKDGQCLCDNFRCLIDRNNIVIQKNPITTIEPQQVK